MLVARSGPLEKRKETCKMHPHDIDTTNPAQHSSLLRFRLQYRNRRHHLPEVPVPPTQCVAKLAFPAHPTALLHFVHPSIPRFSSPPTTYGKSTPTRLEKSKYKCLLLPIRGKTQNFGKFDSVRRGVGDLDGRDAMRCDAMGLGCCLWGVGVGGGLRGSKG